MQPCIRWKCERAGSLLGIVATAAFSLNSVAIAQGFGDPLSGLSPDELELFEDGKVEFREVETREDGLGPTFNAQGCAVCHAVPAVGGSSPRNEVRAGQNVNGQFVDLPGGSLFQIFAIQAQCREDIPPEANVIAERQTQPLFGMGLIEAIPRSTIEANADPNDANGDGISGRAGRGRFGWKAQVVSLIEFAGDAYVNEMGITSDLFPNENPPNGDFQMMADCDEVPDPEDVPDAVTGRRNIDDFANFMRFLGPPQRRNITADVTAGEAIFSRIGCASCHIPVMMTGPNAVPALNQVPVPLFSDLLLHDVGTGDGIAQGDALPNELRTPPLWGLTAGAPFLHDGRASNIEQAILAHAGEATAVTNRFRALGQMEQAQLLAFLRSL